MRPLKNRAIVAAVAGLLLTALVSACGSSSGAANSAGSAGTAPKTVRIGVAVGPPFMFRDASGGWTSFSAELARKFGKAKNLNIQFVPTTFPTIVAGLQANKYDFIQPINATPARSAVIDFSNPVSAAGALYFVKQGSTFKTLDDMNKPSVKIATISGSAEEEATRKLLPKATLRSLPNASVADLATEVTAGRSDVMVDSSYLAPALESKFPLRSIPDYKSNPDGLGPVNIGFAVRKGDTQLLTQLNDFIASEKASGDLKALADKWLTVENALKG
jgi:polar amino acid transport system substrate-binding protein